MREHFEFDELYRTLAPDKATERDIALKHMASKAVVTNERAVVTTRPGTGTMAGM